MTHPDDLRAEAIAASYVRAYLETDATFDEIASHLSDVFAEGPEGYVGRRRARECPDPWQHDRLDRSPSQELRFPPQAKPGHCRWCDGLLPEED